MKIFFGIQEPYVADVIDWDLTHENRLQIKERTGIYPALLEGTIRVKKTLHKDLFFTVCDICGEPVPSGRSKRGVTTCSPRCNKIKNERWCEVQLQKDRERVGERPYYFWGAIRQECFERDGYRCQGILEDGTKCNKDLHEEFKGDKPAEAHHIIPISKGGTNQLDNLKSLCYDCHKREHAKVNRIKKEHISLDSF